MPPHKEVSPVVLPKAALPTAAKSAEKVFPTLSEIKARLPKEFFVAELHTSIYYVIRSAVLVVALFYTTYTLVSPDSQYQLQNVNLRALVWLVYWYLQGMVMWGIFTLGHDCGHASFSKYPIVNLIFGNILHTFLLVPYEPWKVTHRLHHKNTGNIDKDEIFYPYRDDTTLNWVKRVVVIGVGFAWMVYLYVNTRRHFWIFENIYEKQRGTVLISHLSFAAMVYIIYSWIGSFGFELVFFYYFVPLFLFMCWIVITTFLHHQDEDSQWYANSEWTYVKGNLSSVDRSYGPVVNNIIHNIGTHQIHHLFPKIPHYKLVDATEVFRKEFPDLVRKSDDAIIPAFVRLWSLYLRYAAVAADVKFFSYKQAQADVQKRK